MSFLVEDGSPGALIRNSKVRSRLARRDTSVSDSLYTDDEFSDYRPNWQPLPSNLSPKAKNDCKKGGYKTFGFKNQGKCVTSLQKAAE